ncbi:MAG: ATP-binding protein, partial [Cryomorphaceae bacterium]
MSQQSNYTEDNIRSLEWDEHIRLRPGMYIGKLGDGKSPDDGIYILLKEVLDNSIDEFVMGAGKTIEVKISDGQVIVRDYGRGIPLGKVVDVVSKINTGAKYDSKAFKKSVGLNGVGAKAVNALSTEFIVQAFRDGKTKRAKFEYGKLTEDDAITDSSQRKGTKVAFRPDPEIFVNYRYILEYVEKMLWNYAYLNPGLTLYLNGEKFYSENGLKDLLQDNLDGNTLHDIIHLKGEDIEVALTHSERMQGEQFYSFVNGQHTTQGGTHQNALREALVATMRDFYGKNFDASDVRSCVIGAISLKVMEPVFESQTKTKLGSLEMAPGEIHVRTYVINFMKKELDNFLHRNADVAEAILKKIQRAERERKDLQGIRKLAR